MQEKLFHHERWVAYALSVVMVGVVALTYMKALPHSPVPHTKPLVISDSLVDITIKGAVLHPGVYRVKKGTFILEVIQMAKPLKEANLTRYHSDETVKRKRTLKVAFNR